MQLSGELFGPDFVMACGIAYGAFVLSAVRHAPWRKLLDGGNSSILFGSLALLMLLWSMRVEMMAGVAFHLIAMTVLTLMVGWCFAVLGGSLVLAGVILAGFGDWSGYFPTALVAILLPASLTWVMLLLARAWLPRNFFIYVLLNGFMAGGLIAMIAAYTASLLLLYAAQAPLEALAYNYYPWIPLMFFPEAMLNGWIITILVILKPAWVFSFSDEDYLHGK
ncbi:MAG TPA: molecular chaperone DnaJ [Gammaproteobacteria bacterium]|nr:molecular chaperone DnaJ [Gammaproteobacteria bacterium]